jgi:hypothetical protein
VKRSKVTSESIDFGSPTDYQSATEQNGNEQEYSFPLKPERDSSQDDSSDNSGTEPETPQARSQIHRR